MLTKKKDPFKKNVARYVSDKFLQREALIIKVTQVEKTQQTVSISCT
jgi:uncharacterized membrane-anchored protein YjiN (DUF445 family)